MKELTDRIHHLDDAQLQQLLPVVQARFAQLHPERELLLISLSRDPALRQQELEFVYRYAGRPEN